MTRSHNLSSDGNTRGNGDEEEQKNDTHRVLEEYVCPTNKFTHFFTTELPDDIFEELLGYF